MPAPLLPIAAGVLTLLFLSGSKKAAAAASSNGFLMRNPTNGVIQVRPDQLAGLLGLPSITFAKSVVVEESTLKVERQTEAGYDQVSAPLPALVTVTAGVVEPRYASFKGIMAAKKKEIQSVDRASLGLADEPTQKLERIYVPQKTKKTEFLTGSAKEVAANLLEKLRHEARVIS